ncbi:YkvA family protein [Thalassotalea mangrovi]|uniref:DUF1232 domain-containing protein n=1 Tax=Thalassotalea mangrovi TaxID=2572245 RepID=A0A4U1B9I2_9GAMM|nr:YkvA family protein [Thalassotalea mangrovi]TKB47034.1 DUF1232 domain-containing protein [Thalassotalea mangrovi]
MAFEVTFELSDSDLEHFRGVMHKAQNNAKHLSEETILANAKRLIDAIHGNVPGFVKERIDKLQRLIAMIEDQEWQLPEEEKQDVLCALAYFSDPQDLVPDDIPALGFLDDAIMIELVAMDLHDDIEAFDEFCSYREREKERASDTITKDDWLDAKRRELHSRMRHRRSSRRSGGSSFRSIF